MWYVHIETKIDIERNEEKIVCIVCSMKKNDVDEHEEKGQMLMYMITKR